MPGVMPNDGNLHESCMRSGIIVSIIGSVWHLENHTVHF
jgi:hypothetical protein